MKNKIIKKLKKLETFFSIKYKYKVNFNLNSDRVMGSYSPSKNTLFFNLIVANKVGFKEYKEVVIHEFAHMIVHQTIKFRVMPHGKEWKKIMKTLKSNNIKATISFSKTLPNRTKVYCKCSSFDFTKNKLTRLRNGTVYRCKKCSKKIKEK